VIKKRAKLSPVAEKIVGALLILWTIILVHKGTITWAAFIYRLLMALRAMCAGFLLLSGVVYLLKKFMQGNELPAVEALAYLKTRTLAPNRFKNAESAVQFVDELYRLGAAKVMVDHIRKAGLNEQAIYADTLVVTLPVEPEKRKMIFDICAREEREEWQSETEATKDRGQKRLEFLWA